MVRRGGLERLPGLVQIRGLGAQAAAQRVERLDLAHVGAVRAHPAHPGEGLLPRRGNTHDDTVGNGKDLPGTRAIGLQQVADRLLHPVDLSPAQEQVIAQLTAQGQQLVVIQERPPLQVGCFGAIQ